jgi:GNAT superfamily N-acetyltransferase
MHIQLATLKDYPRLVALDRLARSNPNRRRWLRRAVRERVAYVLVDLGRIVAYGILTRSFFQRPFVEMLYVAEDERRKGYGESLLAALEDRGLRHGDLWTSTNRSNKPMRRLLKKRGFALAGRISGLDAGDPELFYHKTKR